MSMILHMRPVGVSIQVALRGYRGRDARITRMSVMFPDIGKPVLHGVGFLRYAGEKSVVSPEATEQELSLQPGLTVHL